MWQPWFLYALSLYTIADTKPSYMWYVLLQAVFPALLIFHDPVYVVSLHVNLFALSLYHFQTLIILRGIVYPFIRFF